MIDFTPGSTSKILYTLSDENEGVTGATVKCTVVNPSGTTIVSSQNATEEGNGVYSYTISASLTTTLGTYFVTWNVTSPTTQVDKTTFVVGYQAQYNITRLDIRHSMSRLVEGVNNFVLGTVDSATTTTIVDSDRMEPDPYFTSWQFYIYAGTAMGQERRCSSFSEAINTLTFSHAYNPSPAAGDLYEGHKYFSVDDYNDAIRLALMDICDTVLIPISDSTITLVSNTTRYEIPAGFSHIFCVQINVFEDEHLKLSPAAWDIDRATRTLVLNSAVPAAYAGQTVKILGLRPPQDIIDDESPIDVRPGFIIKKASAYMCFQKMASRENEPGGWTLKHQMFEAEAQLERNKVSHSLPNNVKRVEL